MLQLYRFHMKDGALLEGQGHSDKEAAEQLCISTKDYESYEILPGRSLTAQGLAPDAPITPAPETTEELSAEQIAEISQNLKKERKQRSDAGKPRAGKVQPPTNKSPDKPKKRRTGYHLAMNDKFISFESMDELDTYLRQSGFVPPIPAIKGGKIVTLNVQYVVK